MSGLPSDVVSADAYAGAIDDRLTALARDRFVERLWAGDPALWTRDPAGQAVVRNALGWLRAPAAMKAALGDLRRFAEEAAAAGLRQVLHMGMGGSSLAPLVFERTFAASPGSLRLAVLDTTDPATILADERWAAGAPTLFIVASKSGTTAEPLAFGEYFYAKQRERDGDRAGSRFAVITDPGTPLDGQAAERGYRGVFPGMPDVGGRYSALTPFGLVPAVLAGVDAGGLLERALGMAGACGPAVPPARNPGVHLGAVLGELARRGRDKVTLLIAEPVAALGGWLEQLLAESTGKQGTGLLPVADEPVGEPAVYGQDRVFVHIRLRGAGGGEAARVDALRRAGHPVVTLEMDDPLDLGQEFFRWEIATATAGAILEINAFDQPNVQESKDNTNRLLDAVRREGRLPEPAPPLIDGPLAVYAAAARRDAAAEIGAFLAQRRPGGYIAITAYLTETPDTHRRLQNLRIHLRNATRLATTLGYGPRFLHSTGQYHKGGPATGVFLQITADDPQDTAVPGAPYTFGQFKRAQALGDLEALGRHGQRALRIHLRGPVDAALDRLHDAVTAALAVDGRTAS